MPTSVLDFVNAVRGPLGLPETVRLDLATTEPDHESRDMVGSALGVPVGKSEHLDWAVRGVWVMRLQDSLTAGVPDGHGFPSYVTPTEPVLACAPGIVRWEG